MKKLTSAEELTKQTYNNLAIKWSASHSTKSFWFKEMLQFNGYLPKGKILDVGSGAGRDAAELSEYGYDYVGTDFSSGLIEQARKNNPGFIFKEISLYDLNFKERFDGFWCAAVLLHTPKVRVPEALKAIRKNMKPGAIGFISIKEGKGEDIEVRRGIRGYDRLISYWQKEDFRKVLNAEGFEVIEEGEKPYKDSIWLTFIVRSTK